MVNILKYDMDKSLKTIGQVGEETLKALAAGLRDSCPAEPFLRRLAGANYRHEEISIVKSEIESLKLRHGERSLSSSEIRIGLLKMIHVKMLETDVDLSFAKILALNLMQSTKLLEKRMGYLAALLLLDEDDELSVMAINTIQRDLKCPDIPSISMALIASSKLVSCDMVASVFSSVEHRCHHPNPGVRKRALLCCVTLAKKDSASETNFLEQVHSMLFAALCDKSPHVMATALILVVNFVRDDPQLWLNKGLAQAIAHIQHQVLQRKLPRSMEHANIPAPQVQVNVLQIMGLLGKVEPNLSQHFLPIIKQTMEHCEVNHRMTHAIIFECVQAVGILMQSDKAMGKPLLDAALACVEKFLNSPVIDIQYMGMKALKTLVKLDPKCVLKFQQQIVQSLSAEDKSLCCEAIGVLNVSANPQNAKAISARIVDQLKVTEDKTFKLSLARDVIRLTGIVKHEDLWFIDAITYLLKVAGDVLLKSDVNRVTEVIRCNKDIYIKKSKHLLEKLFRFLTQKKEPSCLDFYFVFSLILILNSLESETFSLSHLFHHLQSLIIDKNMIGALKTGDNLTHFLLLIQSLLLSDAVVSESMRSELLSLLDSIQKVFKDSFIPIVGQIRLLATDRKYSSLLKPIPSQTEIHYLEQFAVASLDKGGRAYVPLEERDKRQERQEDSKQKSKESQETAPNIWTSQGHLELRDKSKRGISENIAQINQETEILASQLFSGIYDDSSNCSSSTSNVMPHKNTEDATSNRPHVPSKLVDIVKPSSKLVLEDCVDSENNQNCLDLLTEEIENSLILEEDYLKFKQDFKVCHDLNGKKEVTGYLSEDSLDDSS